MKIAIASDVHDNLPYLRQFLSWVKKNEIESVICCGDITNSETLKIFANGFAGKIYLVRGNTEIYNPEEIKRYQNISYLGRFGFFVLTENFLVGICHEPSFIEELSDLMNQQILTNHKKIIFYGHTHKPWEETVDDIKTFNPGALAGTFSKPSFACWQTKTGEIDLLRADLLNI